MTIGKIGMLPNENTKPLLKDLSYLKGRVKNNL